MKEEIRPIPKEFKTNGYLYRFVKREGKVAMYEVIDPNTMRCEGYEVHKIRIKKAKKTQVKFKDGTIWKIDLPKREKLASNEDFGKYWWYYVKKDNADTKFNELR